MEMKAPNTTTQPQPPSGGLEREADAMSTGREGTQVRVKTRDERKVKHRDQELPREVDLCTFPLSQSVLDSATQQHVTSGAH